MDIPRAPDDVELKNIIDKLANFVARNGPEFEHMTKQKQKDNPKFSFLFCGEYFNYYQYRVTTEQAVLKQQHDKMSQQQAIIQQAITQQSIRTAPWQQSTVAGHVATNVLQEQLEQQRAVAMEQIQQSEANLAAQYQSIMQQQQIAACKSALIKYECEKFAVNKRLKQTMIDDAICAAKREQLVALSSECQLSLEELDGAVQPIIDSCTKEAISNGKNWIFVHNTSQRHGDLIAHYLLDRVSAKDASFELRLHLIYLINDILHHCLRRNADDLRKSLESVVIPLFCISQLAVDEERQNKLKKLLNLWANNNYFEPQVIESLKNPFNAMAAYQAGLMATHAAIVSQISQEMNGRYLALQKQHQEFAAHLNGQIAALEHQLMMQTSSGSAVGSSSISVSGPNSSAAIQQTSNAMDGSNAGNMSAMPQSLPGSSVGFTPQGFAPSAPHFSQHPPAFGPPLPPPPPAAEPAQQFDYSHGQGDYAGMAPMQSGPAVGMAAPVQSAPPLPLPDLSKPPPGFPQGPGFGPAGPPSQLPPLMSLPLKPPQDTELMPSMPYYDLPAGLMAPLVKLEDCDYTPLNPQHIRLPPPMPPTDRLLAAVEAFYSHPSHERPRDSDGWEKLGLFEFFKAKQKAKKMKEEMARRRSRSRSTSPQRRRHSNKRRSASRSRSHSASPSRHKRSSRSRSRSASRSRSRSRSKSREKSRTPPGFYSEPYYQATTDTRLGEENKGHQLLTKMGWGGGGLGQMEQGVLDPVQHAEVRDRTDLYKGIGISLNDPFENFRKNKSHGFVTRMREKAEEAAGNTGTDDVSVNN